MTKYKMPTVGTIFPAKETNVPNPGQLASIEELTRWLQAHAQNDAFGQNALIAENWLAEGGGWGRWLVQYQSGRMFGPKGQGDPNAAPPVPPRAKCVEVMGAEAGGIYFEIVDSEKAVCSVPKYAKIPAPQHYQK